VDFSEVAARCADRVAGADVIDNLMPALRNAITKIGRAIGVEGLPMKAEFGRIDLCKGPAKRVTGDGDVRMYVPVTVVRAHRIHNFGRECLSVSDLVIYASENHGCIGDAVVERLPIELGPAICNYDIRCVGATVRDCLKAGVGVVVPLEKLGLE
jgi:hypothetical protein